MKKLLVIFITVVLVLSLSACGENNDNKPENSDNSVISTENNSTSKSKNELVYDLTDNFDYTEVDGGITITYFKNYNYVEYDKIIVPESIDGKNVVGIGSLDETDMCYGKVFCAIFGKCEVIIPDTVTYIGGESFSGAKGLVKLSGGKNCKTIGEFAFMNCENLTEVTFIDNVTDLAESAFAGCTKWNGNN